MKDRKAIKLKTKLDVETKKFVWLIGTITIIGFILRLICCFWGWPYQLHPDEHVIVDNAIDMLKRQSWMAYVYNRPDQFEIKCNAIIYTIFSWIKYHMPAYEAFESHKSAFYWLARFYTTMFGTAMIPLMAVFAGRLLKFDKIRVRYVQMIAAILVAFSPLFIVHSAYATPDIPLTFFSILVAYLSIGYLEKGTSKNIYAMAIVIGICITIKYPAAVMCFYLAFIVIYRCLKDANYIKIIKLGISSICIVLITIFVVAPNLLTDFQSVIEILMFESGPTHLGADGLSFTGNMWYYLETVINKYGLISLVALCLGIMYVLKNRKIQYVSLLVSIIFWICLSVLSVHWERWGLPMYVTYVIMVSIGAVCCLDIGTILYKKIQLARISKVIRNGIIGVMIFNTIISGLVVTKWSALPDTRLVSMEYCEENKINDGNSLHESYTPLTPALGQSEKYYCFDLINEKLSLKEDFKNKRYYVLSSSYRNRYIKAESQYPEIAAIYKALDSSYKLIYKLSGEYYPADKFELKNIYDGIQYILTNDSPTGADIYIYDLQAQP